MADIWAELGLGPTRDRATIRRAYAVRLKEVSPDADPQGFARLRAAYEQALAAATGPAPAPGPAAPAPTRPEPVPPAPPPPPSAAPEVDGVADRLRGGDVRAAADWLLAARPGLSLDADMRFTDRLGWAMAQDRTLSAEAVRDAAARLGWLGTDPPGAWAGTLRTRLDAEHWLAGLRRDAASGMRLLAGARAVSARILLGRGAMRGLGIMAGDALLRRRYGEYLLHAGVVGDQFDPVRIERVAAVLTAKPDKPVRRRSVLLELFGSVIIASVFGQLAGALAPAARDGVTGLVFLALVLLLYGRRVRQRLRRQFRQR